MESFMFNFVVPQTSPIFPTAYMGSSLGKFVLGQLLGSGTFGIVIAAKHMDTGHLVAIKMVEKKRVRYGGRLQLLTREICIMSQLRHPHVVRLFEVIETETHFCLVMELLPHGNLSEKLELLRRDRVDLSESQARRYFQQLVNAVHFCHRRGVYHRDIKLENLFLDSESNLKLGDFGLSAMLDQVREDGLLYTFCGSPLYLAPEVLNEEGYDGAAADLWSCGVVLYRLLTGTFPFEGQSLRSTYAKIRNASFDIPPGLSPGHCQEKVAEAVQDALSMLLGDDRFCCKVYLMPYPLACAPLWVVPYPHGVDGLSLSLFQ